MNNNLPAKPQPTSADAGAEQDAGEASIHSGATTAPVAPANPLDRLVALKLHLATAHQDAIKELIAIWQHHPEPSVFSRTVLSIIHDTEIFTTILAEAETKAAIANLKK